MDCDTLCNEIHAHMASYHTEGDLNESNPGLGYRRFLSRRGYLMVGGYNNSIDRWSAYVGGGFEFLSFKHLAARISLGAVSGYEGGVTGFLIPELVVKPGVQWGVVLSYIPEVSGKTVETLGLSLVYQF